MRAAMPSQQNPNPETDAASVTCRIHGLSRAVTAAAARLLAPFEVTPAEAMVMYLLARGETMPSRIAQKMAADPSNLSRLIRSLESRGWATRAVDDDNRTRAVLRLTPAGKRIEKKIGVHADILASVIETCLTDREAKVLDKAMAKIQGALSETVSLDEYPAPKV